MVSPGKWRAQNQPKPVEPIYSIAQTNRSKGHLCFQGSVRMRPEIGGEMATASFWLLFKPTLKVLHPKQDPVQTSHTSAVASKMVYPEPGKELRRRISAAMYGWDNPFLTFLDPGFEHVAQMKPPPKALPPKDRRASIFLAASQKESW